jgi:hypothetical protein
MVAELGLTETEIAGGGVTGAELPPPHAAITANKIKVRLGVMRDANRCMQSSLTVEIWILGRTARTTQLS